MKILGLVVASTVLVAWLFWNRPVGPIAPGNTPNGDNIEVVARDPNTAIPATPEQLRRESGTPTTTVIEDAKRLTPEKSPEENPPPERIDITRVEPSQLIQALKDEATDSRRVCYDKMLVENLTVAAKLTGLERVQAEESARELADAEYEMRILRTQILENRYVYQQPATVKVDGFPGKGWFGQGGTLQVGEKIADYAIMLEEYPELQEALNRRQRAHGTFQKLTAL